MVMYDKENVGRILLSSNIRELYQVPTDDEDFVIFVVPRRLTKEFEKRLRNQIQPYTDKSCVVVSTEFDICENYCVFSDGKWIA